jgi:CRISPR system Cascade subunit CasD
MQSWGTTSRFDERDTQLEPSKSGVFGLVCAALGRDRHEPVNDLAALKMGVRVEREGVPMRDYQTATGVVSAAGEVNLKRTVVSPRFFLSDAVFLVGLEGTRAMLEKIHLALQTPVWPLALGRKSFAPSLPVYLPDGLVDLALEDALRSWPCLVPWVAGKTTQTRLIVEDLHEGVVRMDQPIALFAERRFGPRFVKTLPFIFPAGGVHVSDPTAA